MNANPDLIDDIKRKMLAKYPRFGNEVAVSNIEYTDNLKYKTAATDGKKIYIDPNYFASLSENDRLFMIAHEIMHIKFMHMYRLKDKSKEMKNLELWNIATDAIINANLERDGFRIKEGYVNMPEALNYSAEEFYQILLQKKQEEKNNEQNKKQEESNEQSKKQEEQNKSDDHSMWEKVYEQYQNKQEEKNKECIDIDEKNEFKENRKEKIEKFKSRREKTEKSIRKQKNKKINLGDVGESKNEIDWKLLIRREIEKTETMWSRRRAIAENNYAYRLEENDIEEAAETEIMLDVSGSVDEELLKAFLRQIKPVLKQSKLKVGCFNEEFWGFVNIKNVRDINNFVIPEEAREDSAWTEDWDLAVRSFTPKKEINKIVFTDGYPCPGNMPKEDLKRENIVWLVYGNEEFEPCCGKVINITERQLEKLYITNKSIEDIERE